MDRRKIFVANLSKGRLGEDNATLLGAFLVKALQTAALSRADIPEESRIDFTLVVDEFQNFATGAFATILSEARKFRLSLIVAHQYTRQLDESTLHAILGNVGSLCVFGVGSEDAELLAPHLSQHPRQIAPEQLTNLPKFTACVRLLLDGMPGRAFLAGTSMPNEAAETKGSTSAA